MQSYHNVSINTGMLNQVKWNFQKSQFYLLFSEFSEIFILTVHPHLFLNIFDT